MSVFRPKNINIRLVGTAGTMFGSPGNGGQLGSKKTPYLGGSSLDLGDRFQFGCCSGVFRVNESSCGRKEDCQCTTVDCKGFFICCGPGSVKWFVSPFCTQISRCYTSMQNDAVGVASACMGNCGWFVPTIGQFRDPGYCCRTYWDCYSTNCNYFSSSRCPTGNHCVTLLNMATGGYSNVSTYGGANPGPFCVRAFRCTAT